MSTRFYRARIVLEEVTSTPHESGYPTEHTSTMAEITVSGHSPLTAIERAAPHLTELGANYRDRAITRAEIHGVVPAGAFDGLQDTTAAGAAANANLIAGVRRATGGIIKNPTGIYMFGKDTKVTQTPMPFQSGED